MHTTRNEFIDIVCTAYFRTCPNEAREMARFLKEVTSQDIRDGKWRSGNAMVTLRFPQNLFNSLRACFARANIFPLFGDDSADIRYVCSRYPDLFRKRKPKRC